MRATARLLAALAPVLVLLAVAVGPALVGQRIFLAGDLVEQAAPWHETTTHEQVHNACVHDTIDSAMPSQLAFRDRVAQGEWPDVEPRTSAGHLLGASPSVGTSSPLFLATLPFSDTTFTAWLKVAEVATIVLGCVLWARRLGIARTAGAVGGFLFATSGYMLLWTNWPQTRTAAFFPLIFWAVERVVQDRTLRSLLPLPLVVAGAALGGFPAIVVHTAYAVLAYAGVRLVAENRLTAERSAASAGAGSWRRWASIPALGLLGGVVTLGLVAVQLVPWAVQLGSQDLGYRDDWWTRTVEPSWLATLPFGQGLGTCTSESRWWGGPTIPVEAVSFVGAAALVLIAIALVHGGRAVRGARGVLLTIGLVALAATFLGGPVNELLHHLPGMGNSFMARTRAVGGLCLAMLAAIGLDALAHGARPSWRRRRVATGLALGFPLVLTTLALVLRWVAGDRVGWQLTGDTVWLSLANACATCGLWLAWSWVDRGWVRRAAVAVVVLGVTVEGTAAARAWWPLAPVDTFYRETTTSAFLRERLGDGRMIGTATAYHASASTIHDLRGLSGHAFVPPDWAGLLTEGDPGALPSQTNTLALLGDMESLASPVLSRLSVRYGVADTVHTPLGVRRGLQDVDPQHATEAVPARRIGPEDEIRGVILGLARRELAGERRRCTGGATLQAQVLAEDGTVLARGERLLRRRDAGSVSVALNPVDPADRARQARVEARVVGCEDQHYWAVDPVGDDPAPDHAWLGLILAQDDGLVQVPPALVPDALVYENPDALERFRWASRAEACTDVAGCAERMGRIDDATTLLHPEVLAEVPFDGRGARVDVVRDAGDEQVVRVDARGDGMLVVADSVQPGWSVEVDGEPARLRHADVALRAVAVPAGSHEVRFVFTPVGRSVLGPLALATAAAWAGVALACVWRDRRRARHVAV